MCSLPGAEESAATEKATGRSNEEWFALLDEWGAADRTHAEIAALAGRPGGRVELVVADGHRRLRAGPRPAPAHERPDGFTITASKTVAVPVAELFAALSDDVRRARWLPDAPLRLRTSTAPRSARYDWEDGATRVNVGFTARSRTSSTIALAHERLPDPDAAEAMKLWWRGRLAELKALLEAPSRK